MGLTEEQQRSWDRGVALSKEGRLEDAQIELDQLAKMVPDWAPAWLARAHNLDNLHRYEEALAAAEHGLALDRLSSQGWNIKGNVLFCLKRYDEAAFAYTTALMYGFDPKNVPGLLRTLFLAGRYDGILTLLDQFEQFIEDKELVWHYRASAYFGLGRYEDVVAAIEKALALGAGDREFHARILQGNAHSYLGHDEEALAAYEQAIRLRPKAWEGWEGKLKLLRQRRHWRALWQGIKEMMAAKPRRQGNI